MHVAMDWPLSTGLIGLAHVLSVSAQYQATSDDGVVVCR